MTDTSNTVFVSYASQDAEAVRRIIVRPVEDAVFELGEWAIGYAIDQWMSGTKARRELGWRPAHTDPIADIS